MLVSVCIPTRERARHLGAAVRSALAQDVDGLEVIVGDDASFDDTLEVLAGFDDPRLRVVRHEHPLGVAGNRNALLSRARGRLVAWLDSDDEWLPGTLASRLAAFEDPQVTIAHAAFQVIDADGEPLPPWRAPFDRDTVEPSGRAFAELVQANELLTSTVVARRELHLPFDARIGASSTDWAGWLRLARRGDVAYSAGPAARYRHHADTISSATARSGERLRCDVRAVVGTLARERRLGDLPRARAALAARALLQAGDALSRADRSGAAAAVRLAGRLDATARRVQLEDFHGSSRRALRDLGGRLGDTRYGQRIRAVAAGDPAWAARLAAIAATIRRVTPPDARLACVSKWDPTLLELSGRAGGNYPDGQGYPPDGAAAVSHLQELRARGTTHLVVPAASLWWLEHYRELADHLGRALVRDADCAIFELT